MGKICPIIIIFIVGVSSIVFAKTKIVDNSDITDNVGVSDVVDQFDLIMKQNGIPLSNAFALANLGGYAVGNSVIGSFPHLFIGVSLTGGFANMRALDDDRSVPQGTVPVGGINPVIVAGLGLSKNLDFIGKLMLFSSGFVDVPLTYEGMQIDKINIYALGGKLRYNIMGEKPVLPGIFTFSGITVSIGADVMYGIIRASGTYNYPLDNIEVDPDDTGPAPTQVVPINTDIDYDLNIQWFVTTINPQALVYFNFFWIFNIYTGLGLPINFGSVSVDFDASATATCDDSAYILANGSNAVGSFDVLSDNKFIPYYVMPVYIFGIELEVLSFHISFETMVNLYNARDVNMQLATRLQF